ncbi:immunoglobulin-like domain-containing receptor 2 isoform X4 [Carassius carassius]|uniref:immunoglobulin-like domain-containing receptor 2 isoform X4 n=1 Tax=Carassius carassius TaxID=217509 RepID=UPI0028698076|nr:immunoglobulin-like domain-containing receptor 2 isoform X4 [Carassius carassius]
MVLLHGFRFLYILFSLQSCNGVQVIVKDEKKFAMLFSSIVLPCHYTTHSSQTAVVQWWYKSYCTDRTRDSFTFPESLGVRVSDLGASSHLDCSDNSRTVRIVASAQGSSMTLAEHYKGRDISIINKADLRIGQLQWGDSGVYFCKVVISDDLEGINEGQMELLVQGRTGVLDDILPEFDLEIMPADSLSELSSLHDGDTDFRQTYRQVQRKALPPISDYMEEPHIRIASTGHGFRPSHYQSNHSLDEHDNRWNCRSEHLPRKAFDARGRTGSLDELEEFAISYGPHGRQRGDYHGPQQDFQMGPRSRDHPTSYQDGPRYSCDDDDDDWRRRGSPPSPPKRRNTADSERYLARQRSYDDTYLNTLLERKVRGHGERAGRADDDSDTPSKGSSKKSSDCYNSRSPSNRTEEDDPLPPYSEREAERFRTEEHIRRERYRTADPAMQPFSYTRPAHGLSHTLHERREDRDKPRKLTTHLSRDSLIV